MPLLPLEPFVFPDDLLTAAPVDVSEERWWVLHTRPRAEKALARRLQGKRVSHFLPLYRRQWRNGGRAFEAYLPLFGGYLFLFGDPDARGQALATNLVAQVLPVEDQARLRAELNQIYQLVASGFALAPEDRLQPGTWVEIESGPFVGMRGKVITRKAKHRFLVEIELLRRGVSVDLDGWSLRPLSEGQPETAISAK